MGRDDRRPTIADVAREAGVSVGTVSHAISGARQLAPETRRRVDKAIAKLEFRPNLVARSLTKSQTMTVGMVVPDIVNPIFGELLRGAERILAESRYAVLFGSSDNRPDKERLYLDAMVQRRVDGLIVDVSAGIDEAMLLEIGQATPLVLVDRTTPSWPGDTVRSDDEAGMALAVDHIVGFGHTRIALINGEPDVSGAKRRRAGFEQRLAHHGLKPVAVTHGRFTMTSGREQALALLDSPEPPTAICAGNDFLAIGAIAGLTAKGIAVPTEMSVIGYDDIEFSSVMTPSLTTVTQPLGAMGSAAARLLLHRISQPNDAPQSIVMRGELVVRASTGPPRRSIAPVPRRL